MYPKEAWKFKLWQEAMLRGAIVGKPEYKRTGKSTGYKGSQTARKRRNRRKKAQRKRNA